MKKGYTLAEMLIVMGLIVVMGLVFLATFVNRRSQSELTSATTTMAGLLREAQSRSVSQASSSSWGVHFENSSTSFFALFISPYVSSSVAGRYPLPAGVQYATSTIGFNRYAEITFSQISGAATGSSSIAIHLIQKPQSSSTISVSPSGAVSY